MDSAVVTPAPAQAPTPATPISAGRDAANRDDFATFDKAHLANREGKPLPAVTPAPAQSDTPDLDATAAPDRQVSKRQQAINDYERRIAEQSERIARLEGQLAPKPAASAPPVTEKPAATAPLDKFPTLAEYAAAHDGATLDDFLEARDTWRESRTQTEAQKRAQVDEVQAAARARADTFGSRLKEAASADPAFASSLSDDVKAIKPFAGLAPGEPAGPVNVIGELLYDSTHVGPIVKHLSQHPEALTALETMPPHIAALAKPLQVAAHIQHIVKAFGRLEAQFDDTTAAPAEATAVPSTITSAPPPPPTLTRVTSTADPKAAALKRGDFPAWEKLDTAERLRKRTGAA